MGNLLRNVFQDAGHTVRGYDRRMCSTDVTDIGRWDVVVLALHMRETLNYAAILENSSVVIEITSAKGPLREHSGRIISIHPLFGPLSYPENRDICVMQDISRTDSMDYLAQLFPECRFLHITSEEHDRLMASNLVVPYLLSLVATEVILPGDAVTRSGHIVDLLRSISQNEDPEVFADTVRLNPNSLPMIDSMISAMRALRERFS